MNGGHPHLAPASKRGDILHTFSIIACFFSPFSPLLHFGGDMGHNGHGLGANAMVFLQHRSGSPHGRAG